LIEKHRPYTLHSNDKRQTGALPSIGGATRKFFVGGKSAVHDRRSTSNGL